MPDVIASPAEQASHKTRSAIEACINEGKNFLVEAGAGAGKTYSLIEALKYVIDNQGHDLLRQHQRVACITYTNVAVAQITDRTDGHPVIQSSTIHAFCWSLIRDFQPFLREAIPNLKGWQKRLEDNDVDDIGLRTVTYDEMGHPVIDEEHVSLHHNDVLVLMVQLLAHDKFRRILASRYPILFIDEYQDTDSGIADALKEHVLDAEDGPLVGFFGDHWQKIYGTGCGRLEHPNLVAIGKEANFRSVPAIVDCLNRIRPELPQQVKDPHAQGSVSVYHTNGWTGKRLTGQHWGGDLPADAASVYLDALITRLSSEGWDFAADTTKILMLTHKVLAAKQGYSDLANVFPYNDAFIKKEDPYIAFFVDELEPVCVAYEEKRFGEMFTSMGRRTPLILSPADKAAWARDMAKLLELRGTGSIGTVLDHLKQTGRPRLPDSVERRERALEQHLEKPDEDGPSSAVERASKLRDIPYQQVVSLSKFIDEQTPFSTKHGVKGAEFENVLVVFGRGWNIYNFGQFLEWENNPPSDKLDKWERNRNLFYVCCSRPKKRLALLFTQELTDRAIATLSEWFGAGAVMPLQITG